MWAQPAVGACARERERSAREGGEGRSKGRSTFEREVQSERKEGVDFANQGSDPLPVNDFWLQPSRWINPRWE